MDDDPLFAAIYKAIRGYRMGNIYDEFGNGYPLVDLMTGDGKTIADGEEQMGELAYAVQQAVLKSPIAQVAGQ